MLHKLADINNLTDPLKQFETYFTISLPDSVKKIVDAETLELRAKSFDIPSIKSDDTTVVWGGHERKYAGKQTRGGEWTVSFIEVYDAAILEAFRTWANIYHDFVGGTIKLFNEYKTSIEVQLLNPSVIDGVEKGRSLTLYRAWPVDASMSQINPSSSDPVDVTVKFRYDYFILGEEETKAHQSAA